MKRILSILLFAIAISQSAWATTYWVSKSGNDANSCATASGATDPGGASSKLTIASGEACMTGASHTLMIGNGTYTEALRTTAINAGVSGAPTIIRAVNLPTCTALATCVPNVIMRPTGGTNVVDVTAAYVTLDGIDFDAVNANGAPVNGYNGGTRVVGFTLTHFRARNGNDITSSSSGVVGDWSQCTIAYGEIDHNGNTGGGSNQDHGLYAQGPNCSFHDLYIHHNEAYCFQIYPSANDNTLFNLYCYANTNRGGLIEGDGNKLYNFIMESNGWGLEIDGNNDSLTNWIYSGTIYDNGHASGGTGKRCIEIEDAIQTIANIICYQNETNEIAPVGLSSVLNTTTANPSFTNTAGHDFTLLPASIAANAGATLGAPYNSDIVGTSRPQGAAYDIGAYETSATTPAGAIINIFASPVIR